MKIRLPLLLVACIFCPILASIRDGDEDETFIVVRASPNTTNQLDFVRDLHDNMHEYDLDFWLTPHAVGHMADVMVRESRLPWLREQFSLHGISHFVSVPDVQKLIIEREQKGKSKSSRFLDILRDFRKRYKDEGGNRARYGFGDYHSYETITAWMHEIERLYPDRAKVLTIGETEEKRPIKTIKLGTNIHSTSKRIVWIDGGIHAREWAAVHTTAYFIDRLIADYDSDPLVREAMDNLHFYISPVMNPDGYEYSRTGVSPMIRLWRKNRSNMVCKKDRWFRDRCCGGVDLNRNFDWFWGEIGSSADRCSEIYQGSGVWSEAESRAVRDMMFSPELRGKVDAFITLHTYSQMWIHPFSHQRKTVPEDIAETEEVGRKAVSALEAMYGTKYRFGTGADILYPSSGGSDDWAKGKGGAKFVYLLELRPGEEVWDGFILDSRQLMPTAKETWAGVKIVIEAVLKRLRRAPQAPTLDILKVFDSEENPLKFSRIILDVVKELYPNNTTADNSTTVLFGEEKESLNSTSSNDGENDGIIKKVSTQEMTSTTLKSLSIPPAEEPTENQEFPGFGLSELHVIPPALRKKEIEMENEFLRIFEGETQRNKEEEVKPAEKALEVEEDDVLDLLNGTRVESFVGENQTETLKQQLMTSTEMTYSTPPLIIFPVHSVLVTSQRLHFPQGDSLPITAFLKQAVSSQLIEEDFSPVLVNSNSIDSNRVVNKDFTAPPTTTTTTTTTTTSTPSTTTTTLAPTTAQRVIPKIEVVPEATRVLLAERFKQQQSVLVENTRTSRRRGQSNMRFVSGNVQNVAPTVVEHFPTQNVAVVQHPPPCIDHSPWCAAWIRGNSNICQISSIYMRRDCARSCRYCV